jgi:hypothetical protein
VVADQAGGRAPAHALDLRRWIPVAYGSKKPKPTKKGGKGSGKGLKIAMRGKP